MLHTLVWWKEVQKDRNFTILPFVVESELRSIDKAPTNKATNLLLSLRQQIDIHETELSQMIEALTAEQMESLRTTVEYLWGKSYSKNVFNKSTLLKLMREQLNFRQNDIRWGKSEGLTEGRSEVINVVKQMLQEGELTQEQMEKFLKRIENEEIPKK
jgi:hypothetical protein